MVALIGYPVHTPAWEPAFLEVRMAGYPKIWTSILRESWWFELTGIERGIYLQLCIFAKDGHDNGQIIGRSLAEMSVMCAVNYRTIGRSLVKMQELGLLTVSKNTRGPVVITLHNYLKWQEMTAKDVAKYLREATVKVQSKKATTRPDQTKPNQTKPDSKVGKNPDHQKVVDHWDQTYRKKVEEKYDYKGKDWGIIKRLIKAWGAEKLILLIDQFFVSTDPFIIKAGYSVSVLSSQVNKLAQNLKKTKKTIHGNTGPTTI